MAIIIKNTDALDQNTSIIKSSPRLINCGNTSNVASETQFEVDSDQDSIYDDDD